MSKLRVLCLHGHRQSGEKLRGRMAAFRRTFKSSVDFVFVDAPIVVPYEPTTEEHAAKLEQGDIDQDEVRQFSWCNFRRDEVTGKFELFDVDETIEYLAQVVREQGPFDGVFGFSQGGVMASMLLQLQQSKKPDLPFNFSFGIFVAAACVDDPRYVFTTEQLGFPSLHMIGETDAVVIPERSHKLVGLFENPTVLEHPGGHYIPANKEPKDAMRAFIKGMQTLVEKNAGTA
ncbi:hypothetical protein Poli38472_000283 [Pythium oligandrum]|uniref:Serine hydrolase domain-containing protein n=1 Tax=Pythium oligandrum TaxID=41045 RepID=A0A8K1FF72_PYTOL|nr:hypothetical protein Poli38472_000283 [Pythium oligandrum]|eukprot:TMW60241.1 hypothetical protein Poli38472_000283 [Pythium oligandrum]